MEWLMWHCTMDPTHAPRIDFFSWKKISWTARKQYNNFNIYFIFPRAHTRKIAEGVGLGFHVADVGFAVYRNI